MSTPPRRQFIGQAECNAFVHWLSANENRKAGRQVLKLVGYLRLLDAQFGPTRDFLEQIIAQGRATIGQNNGPPYDPRYDETEKRVNRMLAKCSMQPCLGGHTGAHSVRFGWRYRDKFSEGAHLLLAVAGIGFLDRIKRCANEKCRKWFFAKFPQVKDCTTECGIRRRQSSEEAKVRRREWSRKNYQDRKVLHGTSKIKPGSSRP
jgi:hypothetical protein